VRDNIEVVKTLLDALPYIKRFSNEKIVIKYGGSAQTSETLKEQFAQDIVLLTPCGYETYSGAWWWQEYYRLTYQARCRHYFC